MVRLACLLLRLLLPILMVLLRGAAAGLCHRQRAGCHRPLAPFLWRRNLLSGFLLPLPNMRGWWYWAAWINPGGCRWQRVQLPCAAPTHCAAGREMLATSAGHLNSPSPVCCAPIT